MRRDTHSTVCQVLSTLPVVTVEQILRLAHVTAASAIPLEMKAESWSVAKQSLR